MRHENDRTLRAHGGMVAARDWWLERVLVGHRCERVSKVNAERAMRYMDDRTDKSGSCWEWIGSRDRGGYGKARVEGRFYIASRLAYELHVGRIPDGLTIDHLCRNPSCVNPAHLEPVTMAENIRRGECIQTINARKTHCVNGHEFTAENTYKWAGRPAYRLCRACNRAAVARLKQRKQGTP